MIQITDIPIDKPLQEKCGIVALFSPTFTSQLRLALIAAGGVQHRGQHGAGLTMQTKKGMSTYKENGLLKEIFTPDIIKKFDKPGRWTMVHCRYGTNGNYNYLNLQPCIGTTKDNEYFSLAHNGEFIVTDHLRKKSNQKDDGLSDTFLFSRMLGLEEGTSWDEKIIGSLNQVTGAFSLVIGVKDALYASRDKFGIRPMVIGKKGDMWIVASESHALDKLGATMVREINRGEIIRIDKNGLTTIKKGLVSHGHFCDFEWAYFARPDSTFPVHDPARPKVNKRLSVYEFRERCGEILAEEAPIKNISFVAGIPDSGMSIALGYANGLKARSRQVVIRDHFDTNGDHRLFMKDDDKNTIEKHVLGKLSLIPDKALWKNAVVVFCDDSIVRGNVSQRVTAAAYSLGAKEVHWIVGFPPVTQRCYLGVSIRTREELIAVRHNGDVKKIAKEMGATSVHYISPRGLIEARMPKTSIVKTKDPLDIFLKNGGCGGCVTDRYPILEDHNQ